MRSGINKIGIQPKKGQIKERIEDGIILLFYCLNKQQGFRMHIKKVLKSLWKQKLIFYSSSIIQKSHDAILCDFSLLNSPSSSIECIIVKNNPLNLKLFSTCFPLSHNLVLADGGANHFYQTEFRSSDKVRALVGDFDGIEDEVLQYYQDKSVPMEYTSNQQINDFNKALEYCVNSGWRQLFCFGAFGGRMDQTLSSMHLTTKFSKMNPDIQIVLFGKSNIMYHLKKNITYTIRISEKDFNKHGCGLITFGKAAHVETEGFKWNLGKSYSYHRMEWGKFISTCNEMTGLECKVRSSDEIFFVARYSPEVAE